MLDARRLRGDVADDEGLVEDTVEIEPPGRAVVRCRDVVPGVGRQRRGADDGVVGAAGGVLEVAGELAARRVDAEEVVHVQVGRRIDLGPTLGDQRDGAGQAADAGVGGDAAAGPVDPRLEGEGRAVEPARRPERDVLAGAAEPEGRAADGGRRSRCHAEHRDSQKQRSENKTVTTMDARRRVDGHRNSPTGARATETRSSP